MKSDLPTSSGTGPPDRGGAYHPLLELTSARLREFVREPEALFWAFVFPIVIAVTLSVAFPGQGDREVTVGVLEGPGAADLSAVLERAPGLRVRAVAPDAEERALREGDVTLLVRPGTPPEYRFDPDREESGMARLLVDDALKRADGRTDPWTATERPVRLAGSRYVDWLIPGIIGMNIMGTGMWGIGFSVVQARMRKLLKRLMASPMRRREYLLAQVLARLVFLVPEVAVPLLFGALVLGMPIRGSVVAVAFLCVLGALSFGGLALLLASRVKTFEAISGLMNVAMVPMWVLSGVFFSSANYPEAMQPFIRALPLTALNDALRAVILEGSSLASVAGEAGVLALWGAVPFAVALRIFKWR
ncbi:MAG: ABC transporter permease [Vicinamibacterales bacterium]